jgi:guanylate kinase
MTEPLVSIEQIILSMKGHLPKQLFVIAGPSGVGKNTIIKRLLAIHPDFMCRINTYTTREPRADEVSGDQYFFVSYEEFRRLAGEGKLLEADSVREGHNVYGNKDLYSMPADVLGSTDPAKHLVIAEVDIYGARLLRHLYPDCVTIFITAPPATLLERLRGREGERMSREEMARRIDTAREQIRAAREFDYIVFNYKQGDVDDVVAAVESIVYAARMRVRLGADLDAIIPEEAFDKILAQS